MTTKTRPLHTRSVRTPLETYLREIDATPLLNANQEKELACHVEIGDAEARDQLVRANLRLVVSIARKYVGKGLALQDLIAEGNLGLLRAVEAFDPAMNTRFSTYASYWIKQSMKRGLRNNPKTIRIPAYMVQLLAEWRRADAKLQFELGRVPSHEEIVSKLGLPQKQLAIIKMALRLSSSPAQTDRTQTGRWIAETIVDVRTDMAKFEMVEPGDVHDVLHLLDKMDPRAAIILRLRFGLDDEEAKTLQEIGNRLGLNRERVRQLETEALGKLKAKLVGE